MQATEFSLIPSPGSMCRVGRSRRNAFTLLETTISVVIIAVIAAACLPVVNGMADNAVAAQRTRDAAEGAGYAMERAIRLIRDCPGTPTSTGITSASASEVRFSDGRGLRLAGTDLMLRDTAGAEAVLARDVTAFELTYLASDGATSTLATPAQTDRIGVRIAVDGFELRCAAFPRVRMVSP
jgi:prepilin-type N-terminal cleavage/methylation domain-containing protein